MHRGDGGLYMPSETLKAWPEGLQALRIEASQYLTTVQQQRQKQLLLHTSKLLADASPLAMLTSMYHGLL